MEKITGTEISGFKTQAHLKCDVAKQHLWQFTICDFSKDNDDNDEHSVCRLLWY